MMSKSDLTEWGSLIFCSPFTAKNFCYPICDI